MRKETKQINKNERDAMIQRNEKEAWNKAKWCSTGDLGVPRYGIQFNKPNVKLSPWNRFRKITIGMFILEINVTFSVTVLSYTDSLSLGVDITPSVKRYVKITVFNETPARNRKALQQCSNFCLYDFNLVKTLRTAMYRLHHCTHFRKQ